MSSGRHLVVSIDDQSLELIENGSCVSRYDVSTSARGMGSQEGSLRTPVGRFRICAKIGEGMAIGTVFKGREPVGLWTPGDTTDGDLILTRILRLEGLEEGNANTFDRYVYIHGTNDEEAIGGPASHGCIRMRNVEMIELFDRVETGDVLDVLPATRARGSLCFVHHEGDCSDCTLRGVEGLLQGLRASEWITVLLENQADGDMPGNAVAVREFAKRSGVDVVPVDGIPPRILMQEWIDAILPERVVTVHLGGDYGRFIGDRAPDETQFYFDANGLWRAVGPLVALNAKGTGVEAVKKLLLA